MSLLEREVSNYMVATGDQSTEAIQAAEKVVELVNDSNVQENLLRLIQSMGEYLTSEDEFIRAKATGLLSYTLQHCKHESINESAVTVLVDFYCERLREKTSVSNLLNGLMALTEFENFNGKNAVTVAKRMFERVEVQRHPQLARNTAYRVFTNLVIRHDAVLKTINNEFVYGFTKAMDGEKDPRCLMSAFKLVKMIIDEFDISTYVEDLFEVTFCYFPITFKPPPDDPYGITAEDLKISLRQCLSATPLFAKFAVPLILEKLSSTSGSAKKDSMETLTACAPVFGAQALSPNIEEIFDSLKVEVLHATDESLENAALQAITSVVATLAAGVGGFIADPTEKALKPLIDECVASLKDTEPKNAKPNGRILHAAASASDPACTYIVNSVIPLLLRYYRETEVATRRKAILDVILEFLEAGRELYGSINTDSDMDQDCVTPLLAYKERFFSTFEMALMASNEYNGLRLSGLQGLKQMILTKDYLSSDEASIFTGIAIQSFNKMLLDEADEELRSAALQALSVVAEFSSQYLVEQTIPALINRLPKSSAEVRPIGYAQILRALKTLCPFPALFEMTTPLLLRHFDLLCETEMSEAYPRAVITTLLDILNIKSSQGHEDVKQCIDTIIPHLLSDVVRHSLSDQNQIILSASILEPIASTISLVFQKADSIEQKRIVDRIFALYRDGDLSAFAISSTAAFSPFSNAAPEAQKETVLLFSAILSSCRKDVVFPIASTEAYLDYLTELALKTTNRNLAVSLARIIGSMINKWLDKASLLLYVETTSKNLQTVIEHRDSQNALLVYLWVCISGTVIGLTGINFIPQIAKALIMRSHPAGYELAAKIIEWCSDLAYSDQAPQGFDILVGDDLLALNKPSFATMTILYKQRFFSYCLPRLLDGFRASDEEVKHNYLIALSYLLKNVPKQILLDELPPLIPLLVQSLSLDEPTLKVSTLETFGLAIREAPEATTPHVRTIIPALLQLLKEENPLTVRMAALKCLEQFPIGLPNEVLIPHVNFVTKQLAHSLDDKKRVVRKEAVDCRAKW
ncbi:hypothetical protein EC973_001005 [Apophysomyces ossiformis]|uniref:MMS19 nucleotide excision repair protein n=1 Tax=Apophysomyces ossiformis TaxID=679940 RepID=A0A8H7ETF9_9FUNG|nr:hypothetical protein EC973_001005 [Apophysomyces ossiformis]